MDVTLSSLLHNLFNSCSADKKNINVTTLKICNYTVCKAGTGKTAIKSWLRAINSWPAVFSLSHLTSTLHLGDSHERQTILSHKSGKSKYRIFWQKFAKISRREIPFLSFFVLVTLDSINKQERWQTCLNLTLNTSWLQRK